MTYYLITNLNPFLRKGETSISEVLEDLFIEQFSIIGSYLMMIAISTKERPPSEDPREIFRMQRMNS